MAANRLVMEQDMTIYHALEMKETLLAALQDCGELELDLSGVGDIDTSGMQLLIMVKREATRQHKLLRLVAHSNAVRELMDFYNMAPFFGDPLYIPAQD